MDTRFTFGTWVSAAGHLGLIVWLLAGWGMTQEPLDFEFTPVSVVSGEEYAQIVAASTPQPAPDPVPDLATEVEPMPVPPETEAPPPVEEVVDAPPPAPEPPPEAPAEEAPPPPAPDPVPVPTEVTDVLPDPQPPAPDLPPPAPEVALRPQPRPAQRVAAEAVAPPPPEADIAPEVQQEVSEDATTEAEVVQEAQEATAPEETATEIVTEAEEPSGAPDVALRPMSRPARPAAPAETETASADVSDDVAALLEDVAGAAAAPAAAANPGPPMTGAERDAFRIAVQGCWVVDPGAQAAGVTVTVVFQLDRQGRVTSGPDLLTSSGGTPGAVDAAYQAARRAITRCGRDGFDLPEEKYEQWRVVEMTFDPSGMRLR